METRTEAQRDGVSGALLASLGVAYLLVNRRYALDTLATPGPGLFPLAAGLLLVGLATCQLVHSWRQAPSTEAGDGSPRCQAPVQAPDSQGKSTPLLMIGILVAYVAILDRIGFLTATFILVFICSRLMGARDWVKPIALALGVVLGCHVLFAVWLRVPLPTGYLR